MKIGLKFDVLQKIVFFRQKKGAWAELGVILIKMTGWFLCNLTSKTYKKLVSVPKNYSCFGKKCQNFFKIQNCSEPPLNVIGKI